MNQKIKPNNQKKVEIVKEVKRNKRFLRANDTKERSKTTIVQIVNWNGLVVCVYNSAGLNRSTMIRSYRHPSRTANLEPASASAGHVVHNSIGCFPNPY